MKYVNTSPEEVIAKWVAKGDRHKMLDLSCWYMEEFPDIPDEVERLDIRNCKVKHIPKLPKHLQWLNCSASDLESLPLPLPSDLQFLDCRWCPSLEPFETPKHIRVKSHFHQILEERERETHDAHYFIQKWIADGKPNRELNISEMNLSELPVLPETVLSLNCSGNPITRLHNLPPNLRKLNCMDTKITRFENIPVTLRCLNCAGTKITQFENLPSTLRQVNCSATDITSLNGLPSSVRYIRADYCKKFENIHELPTDLRRISFEDSTIQSIANIPDKVEVIDMYCCRIKSMPTLPESLRFFRCIMTYGLRHITNIPSQLEVLDIDTHHISELPALPKTLRYFCTNLPHFIENTTLKQCLERMGINEELYVSERYNMKRYLYI